MMVVIQTDSGCAITAASITRIPSLSETLFVNLILSLDCTFSLNCKRRDANVLINCQSTWFRV
jgi:hypothetical protein